MAISKKEKVEQFKRECKSMGYYEQVIAECDEKIRQLDLSLDQQVGDNSDTVNKKALLMEQWEIMKEKRNYESRILNVQRKLGEIEDETDYQMLMEAFVNRTYYKKLINHYHFNDSSALYRHLNKVIEKIV